MAIPVSVTSIASQECQESFLARWRDAFEGEINDFVDCIRTGRKPEI